MSIQCVCQVFVRQAWLLPSLKTKEGARTPPPLPLNLVSCLPPQNTPRYAYLACMVTKNRAVKWDGVAKIDLQAGEGVADACVGRIKLPPGHHNGETVFVPRCLLGSGSLYM